MHELIPDFLLGLFDHFVVDREPPVLILFFLLGRYMLESSIELHFQGTQSLMYLQEPICMQGV